MTVPSLSMNSKQTLILATLTLGLLGARGPAQAESPAPRPENYVKTHYTKYEFRIPMRDGVRLFTSVFVPKDTSLPWPFLISRTPYSVAPYGVDQYPDHLDPSDEFEKAGYIFVRQDVRGRYQSEGTFLEVRPQLDVKRGPKDVDESSDTYDTIDYLLKNVPNNNGKAGLIGVSYNGFYAAAGMIDSHPALKAASPQAPMIDGFLGDDWYHGGALMLAHAFGFYSSFKTYDQPWLPPKVWVPFDLGSSDVYDFYLKLGPVSNADARYLKGSNPLWTDVATHDTYDTYWKSRNLAPHLKNIHCAVLSVGGWFDAEDIAGPMSTYHSVAALDPGIPNKVVYGPWPHGGWAHASTNPGEHLGVVQFDSKTAEFFQAKIELPFFEHYLKGKGDEMPNAYVYETGTNVWRTYEEWPPSAAKARLLYLRAGGKLSFDPPGPEEGNDAYVSDPAHPVPFTEYTVDSVPKRYIVDDQRFAGRRPDVLVYESDPLAEDLTIAGPISPKLFVATSGTDSDFVVKLIDVYPDDYPNLALAPAQPSQIDEVPLHLGGYEQLLRGEPMRAKFRNSWEKPEAMVPGATAKLEFTMPDLNHVFRRGHRIMVQVQSSWFPLADLNPQTFTDIPTAKPEDFRKATETVFHSAAAPSAIGVLVLPQL
jgi:putative CocE/NonD family hydrolase